MMIQDDLGIKETNFLPGMLIRILRERQSWERIYNVIAPLIGIGGKNSRRILGEIRKNTYFGCLELHVRDKVGFVYIQGLPAKQ